MEGEVLEIAAGYRSLGEGRLATRLENAAPYLFTFVTHPELHPTNEGVRQDHDMRADLAQAGPERLRRVLPVPIGYLTAYPAEK